MPGDQQTSNLFPKFRISHLEMRLRTYLPCDILQPYVKSIDIQETITETVYKVLPDTSLVMGFQYKGALSTFLGLQETRLSPYGITGMPDRFRLFKNTADTGTVLVFFKVAGAVMFFRESLHEFAGRSVSLDNFLLQSELSLLEEQLQESGTDAKRVRLVEEFLLSRITPGSKDEMVMEAVRYIQGSKGNIKMRELTSHLYVSSSPFEKRFRSIVGTSPKKFASLVRLKNVLTSYRSGQSLTEIAHGAGFYDQSHFIKQFKTFTGDTPENFFRGAK